jgi:hypothetical protein
MKREQQHHDDQNTQDRELPEPTCWGYGVWPTDDDEDDGQEGTSSSEERIR